MAQIVETIVRLDPVAVAAMLRSQSGIVGKYVLYLAQRTQDSARIKMGHDTNKLDFSLVKRWVMGIGGDLTVLVGSEMPYAEMHHEGTPPHIIRPNKRKALRFELVKGSGDYVFAKIVHHPGTQPNRYLTDSLTEVMATQKGIV